jgi:hypothetical protein
MTVYIATTGTDEGEDTISIHASYEGAIAAVRAWIAIRIYPDDDGNGWRQPPHDWEGERWARRGSWFDYVQVDEYEVLP